MELRPESSLHDLIAYARQYRIADDVRLVGAEVVVRHGYEAHRLQPADAAAYLSRLAGNHARQGQ